MDAARHIPQVVHHAHQALGHVGQLAPEVAEPRRDRRLGGAQRERERDKPLLSAIVQVVLDPPARLVRGGHHPGPGGRQLREVLGVGNCGRDKLCERGETRLGVQGQGQLICRADDHGARAASATSPVASA
jgi:hypothetical protein